MRSIARKVATNIFLNCNGQIFQRKYYAIDRTIHMIDRMNRGAVANHKNIFKLNVCLTKTKSIHVLANLRYLCNFLSINKECEMHESYLEMLETKPSMTNDQSPEKRPDKKGVFTNHLEEEQPKPRHLIS